jgi:hypothetical protein
MQCGSGSRRTIFEERKVDEVDVEMQQSELVPAQMKLVQHGQGRLAFDSRPPGRVCLYRIDHSDGGEIVVCRE